MSLSLQELSALRIYQYLRDNPKKCPEGLRPGIAKLDNYYKEPWLNGPENSYTLLCELVKMLPDYADELQDLNK